MKFWTLSYEECFPSTICWIFLPFLNNFLILQLQYLNSCYLSLHQLSSPTSIITCRLSQLSLPLVINPHSYYINMVCPSQPHNLPSSMTPIPSFFSSLIDTLHFHEKFHTFFTLEFYKICKRKRKTKDKQLVMTTPPITKTTKKFIVMIKKKGFKFGRTKDNGVI